MEREFLERLQSLRTQKPAELVLRLFESPCSTVPAAQAVLGTNAATAQQTVNKLVDARILERVSSKARPGRGRPPNLYRCTAIQRVLRA